MKEFSIFESHEFAGDWYLPEAPARYVAGSLSWAPRTATLQLNDTFESGLNDSGADQYPLIYGVTRESQLVTVLSANSVQRPMHFGTAGVMRRWQRLTANWVLVGAHATLETTYSEIRARIPGLQMWLNRGGVTFSEPEKLADESVAVSIVVEGLPEETFSVDSIESRLGWGVDRKFFRDQTSASVTTSASVRLTAAKPQNLEWFLEQLTKITTLLSFIAGSSMAPDLVVLKRPPSTGEVSVLIELREGECCSLQHPSNFYMLREKMGANLGSVFSSWFERYGDVEAPSQLALSTLCSRQVLLHIEFLSLTHALEGFHRATMQGVYVTKSDYEPIKQALVDAIPTTVPSSHRNALKSKIEYGDEFSFRKRLADLAGQLDPNLRTILLGGDDVPGSWVDTRNYYTHWDEALRTKALDANGMHEARTRMRLFLRALYLDFVGIPQSAIHEALRNECDESRYLRLLNTRRSRA